MTLRALLISCTALSGLAGPALALTADDVWQNQTGYLTSLGISVTATPQRDGTTLVIEDIGITSALPMGFGTVMFSFPGLTFVENADGTVSVIYPEKSRASLRIDSTAGKDRVSIGMDFAIRIADSVMTASGTPASVTYTSRTGLMEALLDSLTVEGLPIPPQNLADMSFVFSTTDLITSTTITDTGGTHVIEGVSTAGRTVTEMTIPEAGGAVSTDVIESSAESATFTMTIPQQPVNLLNIAPALRNGLAVDLTAQSAKIRNQSVVRRDDQIVSDVAATTDRQSVTLSLSSAGMSLGGDGQNVTLILQPGEELPIPVPVTMSFREMSGTFGMPLLADPAPQSASFDMALRGVSMPEDLWSLFDPGAVLPRDPATLAFAIDARIINRIDLPDILAWESVVNRTEAGESPFDLTSLSISGLEVAALGAMLTGEGAFTFDNADRTTFPGLPRPEGQASARMTGLYGALARLSQIGLVPAEAGVGIRGAIGLIAEATGDDMLESLFVIAPDGTMTANGRPLPLP